MLPPTIEHSQVTKNDVFIWILVATVLIVCAIWGALSLAFPELPHLDPGTAPNLARAATDIVILCAAGVPIFLLNRRLANIVGHIRFFRVVTTASGLFLMAFDLVLIWQGGFTSSASNPTTAMTFATAFMVGGVALNLLGLPKDQARRRGAGFGCIGAAAFAFVTWAKGSFEIAAVAAVVAIVCGVAYVVLTNVLPGMIRTVRRQIATEWQVVRGRLLTGAFSFALGIGLAIFGTQNYVQGADSSNRLSAYGAAALWISVFAFLFAIWQLFGNLYRLLKSVFPSSPSPNVAVVTEQEVHGRASYATIDQVDAALRDQDYAAGDLPRFKD